MIDLEPELEYDPAARLETFPSQVESNRMANERFNQDQLHKYALFEDFSLHGI